MDNELSAAAQSGYWGSLLKWALEHPEDFVAFYGHLEAIVEAAAAQDMRGGVNAVKAALDLLVDLWESFPRRSGAFTALSAAEVSAFEASAKAHALIGGRLGKLRDWLPIILQLIDFLEGIFGTPGSE